MTCETYRADSLLGCKPDISINILESCPGLRLSLFWHHKNFMKLSTLELGVWGNLNLCSQAMSTRIWVTTSYSLCSKSCVSYTQSEISTQVLLLLKGSQEHDSTKSPLLWLKAQEISHRPKSAWLPRKSIIHRRVGCRGLHLGAEVIISWSHFVLSRDKDFFGPLCRMEAI